MFFNKRAGTRWYDNGYISEVHYTKDTLTIDGNYHDLDISSIVGKGEKLVLIAGRLTENAGGNSLVMRTKGNTSPHNIAICYTQVANKTCTHNFWVYTDVNGIIQYKIDVATWTTIDLVVRGMFK